MLLSMMLPITATRTSASSCTFCCSWFFFCLLKGRIPFPLAFPFFAGRLVMFFHQLMRNNSLLNPHSTLPSLLHLLYLFLLLRVVASLTVPGGQEFHFPHFPQILINFSNFSSNFTYFFPHFGSPGGRFAHPGRPWLHHCFYCRQYSSTSTSSTSSVVLLLFLFFFFFFLLSSADVLCPSLFFLSHVGFVFSIL